MLRLVCPNHISFPAKLLAMGIFLRHAAQFPESFWIFSLDFAWRAGPIH